MSPGLKQTIYLPGDKVSINCTSSPSWPAAKLSWQLNSRPVDRWMVTSYLPSATPTGLESSTLALNFLVLPEHFRSGGGAGAREARELWATCKSDMPRIQGMEIPMERTLLLGSLAGRYITSASKSSIRSFVITEKAPTTSLDIRLRYHQGGWAAASEGRGHHSSTGLQLMVAWLALTLLRYQQ